MVPVSGPLWKSPCYHGEKLFFLIKALHSVQSSVSMGSEGFMFSLPAEVLGRMSDSKSLLFIVL